VNRVYTPAVPDWLSIVLLGIIEGLTEFLPVSSTGHLLLVQNGGWLPHQSDLFNVVIQSGAVVAVLFVFAKRSRELATHWKEPANFDYLSKLAVAFVITAAGGLAMKKFDVKLPETAAPVAWATLIGGVVILAVEGWLKGRTLSDRITWGMAVAVAGAQLLAAMCPGTSRSGACILAAMALGLARPAATEFSFLIGVPTLLAAGGLKIVSALKDGTAGQEHWGMVALGTLVSAITAFIVVKWLLRFVQTHTLNVFGWYRIALGILILVFLG
jgi:undecaprenyl-diphosphatase